MKTTNYYFFIITFLCFMPKANAQWLLPGNANTTATSYIGTTAAAPAAYQDIYFKRAAVTSGLLSTTKTMFGVNSLALSNSAAFGANAGQYTSGAGYNTYIGHDAGRGASASVPNSGNSNTFIGNIAGEYNTSGNSNTFVGVQSGFGNTNGSSNVFLGVGSGGNNASGSYNVFIGSQAGSEFAQGNNNCFIGNFSGGEAIGSNNVFLGSNTGASFQGNNRLLIDITDTQNSLIWGDFAADQLKFNGKVGIGGNTTTGFGNYPTTAGGVNISAYQLFVKGGILTEEVRVSLANTWADYVFNKDYNLKPLNEVEKFINDNGHLPNVPSAAQVKEEGIELGEMAKIQQEKIEELTLYIIALNKKLEAQEQKIEALMQNK